MYYRRIVYNGSSEGLAEISVGIALFLYNITLMKYAGERGVAAFYLVDVMLFVGTSIIMGISGGVIPIISYSWGAKLKERIKKVCTLGIRTNILIGLVVIIVMYFFAANIVEIFIWANEPEIESLAAHGASILSLSFLFSSFNIFTSSYFTALDKPAQSLVIVACRGLIFLCIGIMLLPKFFSLNGVWLAAPCAEILTFVVSLWLIKTRPTNCASRE